MAELHPVMNDTKWRELRDAMYAIGSATIYRIMRVNGYYSNPDAEWFYHFQEGGYDDIRYVDIFATDQPHRQQVGSALKKIHLPAVETGDGFRVYGYVLPGQAVDYLD
ncbi:MULTISPECIES: DUF6678 family protein [Bradyrhizobium]|uniref:DUF6678 family protein n=1 Tax=Bradyrhizobium TaxID=374 RepID=UPI00211F34E2|nr:MULTISPECIES: DUF6678 family protein [Bradyrhizobium]UWU72480.1 hypothetical protein N2602_18725 [Bradyrhizobium sp. NC92]